MSSSNPYRSPKAELGGSRQDNIARFRFAPLVAYAFAGATTWSTIMLFLPGRPRREYLDETTFVRAWLMVFATGAAGGAFNYALIYWRRRSAAKHKNTA